MSQKSARHRRWVGLLVLVAAMGSIPVACIDLDSPFLCDSSDQCRRGDEQGTCEPTRACSFIDATCASGRRYGGLSADGAANLCLEAMSADLGLDMNVVDMSTTNDLSDGAVVDLLRPDIKLRATSNISITAASMQLPRPGSVIAGDIMWLAMISGDASVTMTLSPAGSEWTLQQSIPSGSCGGWATWYYYKVATASEPASYPVAFASSVDFRAALVSYTNVDPVTPINASTASLYDKLPLSLSLLTTADASLLLGMVIIRNTGAFPWSGPTGTVQIVNLPDIAIYSGIQATAGPTGPLNFNGPDGCGSYDIVALNRR